MSELKFLNTDLELKADFDLRSLAAALTVRGLFVLNDNMVAKGFANFECQGETVGLADTIELLLRAIETLPIEHREEFQRCTSRVIDVGFQSGTRPRSISASLNSGTLQRMYLLNIDLGMTVYAAL